ncbi:MAG: hypothetical protein KDD61_12885 [Bdellovibrionales bacterium]|nr:hypothetical protein [Bdellovibrionales bacterium]
MNYLVKLLKVFMGISMFLWILGCESKSDDQSYAYDYTYNGCATGRHEFSSLGGYCAGLKNHSLNNGCAEGLRQKAYEQNCGTDWSVSNVHDQYYDLASCDRRKTKTVLKSEVCNALKDSDTLCITAKDAQFASENCKY